MRGVTVGHMGFNVAVPSHHKHALELIVKANAQAQARWRHRRAYASTPSAVRRTRQAIRQAETLQRLRRRGVFLCTYSSLVAWHVRTELAERGMDQSYEPVPVVQLSRPGRRWGAGPRLHTERADRLYVVLDEPFRLHTTHGQGDETTVAEQLRRSVYWRTRRATIALQRWHDTFGPGRQQTPTQKDEADKARWRRQVVTCGDIIRAAVARAVHDLPSTSTIDDIPESR